MLPSQYSTNDLDIVLIFLELRSIFSQESRKIQGGKIKYHLLLPPFKVESIELLRLLPGETETCPEVCTIGAWTTIVGVATWATVGVATWPDLGTPTLLD